VELLNEQRDKLEIIKEALIEREELTEKEIEELIGVSIHGPSSEAFEVPIETVAPT
jgi:uncharacterized protein YfkK (UPF0435 family)